MKKKKFAKNPLIFTLIKKHNKHFQNCKHTNATKQQQQNKKKIQLKKKKKKN